MGLVGSRVTVAGKDFLDVAWHRHATRSFGVVPVKVHAEKFGYFPVLGDKVVLLENVAEVKGVAFAGVFNAEVVENEGE